MIRIKYNNIEGTLNTVTGKVYFYQFKYENILEAIRFLEHDIKSSEEEIKIFDDLVGHLFITSD